MILTGATGNVGSQLVRELRHRDVPLRVFVRDPARALDRLGEGVELAVGDFADAASVPRKSDCQSPRMASSGSTLAARRAGA